MTDDDRPTVATGDYGRGSGGRGGNRSSRRQDDDDIETRYASGGNDDDDNHHTIVRSAKKPEIEQVAWLYCKVGAGRDKGRFFQLKKTHTVIGRADECDIIVSDGYCGGRHGAIVLNEGAWEVHDFASKNGTFANGQRLGKDLLNPSEIQDDDRIKMGDTEFVFKCIGPD